MLQQQKMQQLFTLDEWIAYDTAEGRPYDHNQRTGETTWQLPPGTPCRDSRAPAQTQQSMYGGGSQSNGNASRFRMNPYAATFDPIAMAGPMYHIPTSVNPQEQDNQMQMPGSAPAVDAPMLVGDCVTLQCCRTGAYLSCKADGKMTFENHTLDEEIFRVSDGQLSSALHKSLVLGMRLMHRSETRVAIHLSNGRYLSDSVGADGSGLSRTLSQELSDPDTSALFEVVPYLGSEMPSDYLNNLRQSGWVLVPTFTPAEAMKMKNVVAATENRKQESTDDSSWGLQVRVHDIAVHHPSILKAAAHPLLVGLLKEVLGEDMRCATFSSNTLLRQYGAGKNTGLGWHVDYPYDQMKPPSADAPWPPVDKPQGMQVLFCLDEFTALNGGTLFRTNTQHLLKPPWMAGGPLFKGNYSTPPPNGEYQCVQLGREPTAVEVAQGFNPDPNITAYHAAPAGSVLIAHSAWWHRQVRNVAPCEGDYPNRRTALLGNYTPADVKPKDNLPKQFTKMCSDHTAAHLSYRDKVVVKELWDPRSDLSLSEGLTDSKVGKTPPAFSALSSSIQVTEEAQNEMAKLGR